MNGESSRYDKVESILQGGSSEPHNVPLNHLRNITNNFSDERLLGEGGFGTVYKGVLPNGETIAVKKLNSSIPGVRDRQFENEAKHLMRLKHPNVVLLVGWCSETEDIYVEHNGKYICAEKSERLLCLEYMPKGNLRGYLSAATSGLDWDTRYKIIEGICYGLRYLHEQWQPNAPIVHMDLKPANILLDNNMVPKIADFGLSRLFSEEKTWTCTTNRDGTLGYMPPEYINRGLISTKSDIFSLGVIIIEIVTGRRDYPDETGASSEEFIEMVLNNWSQRKRVEFFFGHVSLEVEYQQIRKCIQIGLDCVKIDRLKRPTASQIIETLHGLGSADSSNIKGVHRPQAEMGPFDRASLLAQDLQSLLDQELQSRKSDRNRGETGWMERPAKKHTPGFYRAATFTARWRIRVIFTFVVFVVLLKKRAAAEPDLDAATDTATDADAAPASEVVAVAVAVAAAVWGRGQGDLQLGEASVSLETEGDAARGRLLYLENRVALARILFPMEARLAMDIAPVDGTLECTLGSANLPTEIQTSVDLNDTPFTMMEEHLARMRALSKTVELGKRFFPRCSKVLDKVMDDETELASLGRDTSTEKKRRFHDLQDLVQKAFSEDKEEINRLARSSSVSSTTTTCNQEGAHEEEVVNEGECGPRRSARERRPRSRL